MERQGWSTIYRIQRNQVLERIPLQIQGVKGHHPHQRSRHLTQRQPAKLLLPSSSSKFDSASRDAVEVAAALDGSIERG
jgi:hypothetical protein